MSKDGSNDMYYNWIKNRVESEEKVMEDGPCREIVTKEVLYRRLEDAIREEDNNIMLAHARMQVLRSAKWALDEYFADGGLTDQQLKKGDK